LEKFKNKNRIQIHFIKITRIFIKIIPNSTKKSRTKFTTLKPSNTIDREKLSLKLLDKSKKNSICSKCTKNGNKSIQNSISPKFKIYLYKMIFLHCKIKDIQTIFCNRNTVLKTIAEILIITSGWTGKPNSIQL
jgi:hypothetical protein